ncbi:MAG: phosphatase PAP2 family protein [Planctomycetota bacterium]
MRTGLLLLVAFALLARPAHASGDDTIEEIGDIIQIVIPATAAIVPAVKRDWNGFGQFALNFGATMGTVGLAKLVVDKRRPNEANNLSYPSGHTAASFSGAAFLGSRYGAAWGVPAYVGALFVGYSRVQADAHYGDDVLAGASVALLYNWAITKPFPEKLQFRITRQPQGYAFGWKWNLDYEDKWLTEEDKTFQPQFKSDVEFGATWTAAQSVQAPPGTGDEIDVETGDFGRVDEPFATTRVALSWFYLPRHALALIINPFEERDIGVFSEPKNFNGIVLPANTEIRAANVNYDIRLRYLYDLTPRSRWIVKIGGGVSFQYLEYEFRAESGEGSKVSDFVVLPVVSFELGYQISEKWSVRLELEGFYLDSDTLIDSAALIQWQFGRQWDLKLGYRWITRDVNVSSFESKLDQNRIFLGFGYQW